MLDEIESEPFLCIVIPANVTLPCRLEHISGLTHMQQLVGGHIEAVCVDTGRYNNPQLRPGVRFGHEATMYVNEEFRFFKDLLWNARASRFYPWQGGIWGDAFIPAARNAGRSAARTGP